MTKEISPINFYKLYQRKLIKVIDIRENFEFDRYHIKNSVNIPYSLLLEKHALFLNKTTVYYLICSSGEKSNELSLILRNNGYNTVSVIGGIKRWFGSLH